MPSIAKLKRSKVPPTRKFPFLPRVGIYVDAFGYEFIFKHVPLLESAAMLIEKRWPLRRIDKASKDLMKEIRFPVKQESEVIDITGK